MNHKHPTDLRVQKTREAIQETFKIMICELDAEKITVKDLSERARINRKTFYLHYTSIEDLYNEMLELVASGYFKEMDELPVPSDIADLTRKFFVYFSAQEEYVEKLICNPSYRTFCSQLFNTTLKHNRERYNPYEKYSPAEQDIINTFLVNSTLDFYRQWINSNKVLSVNNIISLSSKLLSTGIYSLIEHK